jgi:hypothetical protein
VRQNEYSFDVKSYLKEIAKVDLPQITGLDEKSVLTILAETGIDLGK